MAIERQNYRSAGYVEARSRANKSPSRSSKSRNTTSAGNQNTGNAREDYISNYVSKGIVKGGGTKKAGGGYHDATVSGDRGRSSARETQQAINNAAAIAAAQKAKRKAKNKNITKFGYNKPQSGGINGLIRLLIGSVHPAAGLLMGGFDKLKGGLGSLNDKLGDFREKTTGFRTQQEWEDARTQRQLQGRLDDMYAAKSKGKGFSQKNIDMIEAMGFSPSTAQNVLTGRDLKGFTESRGLQIPKDKPTFSDRFANTVGTTANTISDRFANSIAPRAVNIPGGDPVNIPGGDDEYSWYDPRTWDMENNPAYGAGEAYYNLTKGENAPADNPDKWQLARDIWPIYEKAIGDTGVTEWSENLQEDVSNKGWSDTITDRLTNIDTKIPFTGATIGDAFKGYNVLGEELGNRMNPIPEYTAEEKLLTNTLQNPFVNRFANGGLASLFTRRG
jgi:hypothetical protein